MTCLRVSKAVGRCATALLLLVALMGPWTGAAWADGEEWTLEDPHAPKPAVTEEAAPTPQTPQEPAIPTVEDDPLAVRALLEARLAAGEELTEIEKLDLISARAATVDSFGEALGMLWDYFGVIGVGSLLLWAAALLLLLPFAALAGLAWVTGHPSHTWPLGRHRTACLLTGLVCGLLAWGLGEINHQRVSDIAPDRSKQILIDRQRASAAVERLRGEGAATVEFAEDARGDREDLSRLTDEQRQELAESERRVAEADAELSQQPLYRQMGRVERDADRVRDAGDPDAPAVTPYAGPVVRVMDMHHVNRSRRWNHLNLSFTRNVWMLLAVVLVLDYLARFNMTIGYLLPLPLAGRLVDMVYRKKHLVEMELRDRGVLTQFTRDLVRKGETFVYFGDEDTWLDERLYRVDQSVKWRGKGFRLRFGCVPVLRCREGGPRYSWEMLFESLWFGRYNVSVTGEAMCEALLADMHGRMQLRHVSRARAWGTVNLIWDRAGPMPESLLDELLFLCPEMNWRLVLCRVPAEHTQVRSRLDERFTLSAATDLHRIPAV